MSRNDQQPLADDKSGVFSAYHLSGRLAELVNGLLSADSWLPARDDSQGCHESCLFAF